MDLLNVKVDDQWVPLPAFVGPPGRQGDKGDKGDRGSSGVYYGPETPTDPDINVWIDPRGLGQANIGIDDTAGKGQTEKTWSADKMINTFAPIILSTTEKEFVHEDVSNVENITFYGNEHAFKNCRYANRKNYAPTSAQASYTTIGVNVTCANGFYTLNGTGGSTGNTNAVDTSWVIPAGNYKVFFEVDARTTTIATAKTFEIIAVYTDNTQQTFSKALTTEDASIDITLTDDTKKIYMRPGIRKNVVYNNYTVWVGIYPSDVTITDTLLTVDNNDSVNYQAAISDTTIDTMQHKSVIFKPVDTKEYVDNHIPQIDFVYLSPEMFGAVGDETTDDTTAIQQCVNSAISQGKPIRAYGKYKTTSTIVIDGSNLDMYFKSIYYTGGSTAVTIAGMHIAVRIDYLRAQSTGASGVAFVSSTTRDGTERVFFQTTAIYADQNPIKVDAGNQMLMFICITAKMLSSINSDAITTSGFVTELSVHDCRFNNTKGWCFNGNSIKLFNCTMESNCWGGVYAGSCTIQNCRARELMDCLMPSNSHHEDRSGILFKQKPVHTEWGTVIHIDDVVYYDSIDLSETVVYNDGSGEFASQFNAVCGRVESPIILGDLNYKNGEFILGKEMILHGKDKICIPQFKSLWRVNNTPFDLRDETYLESWIGSRPPYPTKFIIDVPDCIIYLSPSYCAEGYSEFIVDMSTYKATIYDRRGNVIFDAADNTEGVYKFSAIVDHTIDDVYQADHNGQYVYPINSGYCDVWEVEILEQ